MRHTNLKNAKKKANRKRTSHGFRGVTMQLFLIAVLPLSLLVLIITFGSLALHHEAMRSLVAERDLHAIQSAAISLYRDIDHRTKTIELISRFAEGSENFQSTIAQFQDELSIFDGGLALIDANGTPTFYFDQSPVQQFSSSFDWQKIVSSMRSSEAGTAILFPNHPINGDLYTPIASHFDPGMVVIGLFSPEKILSTGLSILLTENHANFRVLDEQNNVLFQTNQGSNSESVLDYQELQNILDEKNGIDFLKTSKGEVVITAAKIETVGWILVDEESWQDIASPLLRITQNAPLIIVPLLGFSILVLWFGFRQIVQPLQELGSKAGDVAKGDFKSIKEPVGGVPEIVHLQNSMMGMAEKLKHAKNNLQNYLGAITDGIENERRNVARELHDDTLQSLIALGQNTQYAKHWNKDPKVEKSLDQISHLTDQGIVNLRRLVQGLRPIYIEDLGLTTALSMLASGYPNPTGIKVHFHQNGNECRFSSNVEMTLYRITQEALSNAFRHASAQNAWISIDFRERDVILEVRDDGIGFEVPQESSHYASGGHFGLLGMYERSELIGAKLNVQSVKGEGTRVTVQYFDSSSKKRLENIG